jgi:putative transposase
VVVSLLHSLRLLVRSQAALHLEIIALRHQLAVVNRSRRQRLRLTSADRMLWAWLSRSWCGWRSAIHIVKPETVIAWHRRGFRLFWTWKSRRRIGRKAVPHDVRAVICEISTANQLWGAPRIHGALQTLGISVSQSTVAKYMRRHPPPPSQTWRTFLTNHASQIMAADLFVVPTITFRLRFVLVILGHDRRRIVHVAITEHPTAAWTAQQLSERIPREQGTAVSPSRSRCGLGRGRDHHRLDEHPGGSYRPTIAVAECVRGTRHRLDPTGVPRSRHHVQRTVDLVLAGGR